MSDNKEKEDKAASVESQILALYGAKTMIEVLMKVISDTKRIDDLRERLALIMVGVLEAHQKVIKKIRESEAEYEALTNKTDVTLH